MIYIVFSVYGSSLFLFVNNETSQIKINPVIKLKYLKYPQLKHKPFQFLVLIHGAISAVSNSMRKNIVTGDLWISLAPPKQEQVTKKYMANATRLQCMVTLVLLQFAKW